METVATTATTDRTTKAVRRLLGEALHVHVSYKWDTLDDHQPKYLRYDIVDKENS